MSTHYRATRRAPHRATHRAPHRLCLIALCLFAMGHLSHADARPVAKSTKKSAARTPPKAALPASPDSGFYLGGALGRGQVNVSGVPFPAHTQQRQSSLAWKLYGGYRFNRWAALEMEYADFGRFRATGDNIDTAVRTEGWGVSGLLSVPLTPRLQVFGKLGALYKRTRIDEVFIYPNGGASPYEEHYHHWTRALGVGVQYQLARNTALRLEYQRLGRTPVGEDGGGTAGRMVTLGLALTF